MSYFPILTYFSLVAYCPNLLERSTEGEQRMTDEEQRMRRWRRAVTEVSKMDGVPERLLLDHVPDRTGHCRACSLPDGGPKVFPCTLHGLATAALREAHR